MNKRMKKEATFQAHVALRRRRMPSIFLSEGEEDAVCKTVVFPLSSRLTSRYLFPSARMEPRQSIGSRHCSCQAIRKFRLSRNTEVPYGRTFLPLRLSFSLFFFPPRKIEFSSHSCISQRRPSFLQIARAARYRIGNFRNLSQPSDDLLPAHRPFDTANALDRSVHSTSPRSIDTSDTLHRDA